MHTHQLQIVDTDGDTVSFSFGHNDKQIEAVSFCGEFGQSIVTYIGHKEARALQAFLSNFNHHMDRVNSTDGDY